MAAPPRPPGNKAVEDFDELLDGLSSLFAPRRVFTTVAFEGGLAEEAAHSLGVGALRFPSLARDQPVRSGDAERRELDTLWMAGFVDHDAEGASGPSVLPAAAAAGGPGRPSKYLSGAEIARVRQVEQQAADEAAGRGGAAGAQPRDLRSRLADSEYLRENERIRRALAARRRAGASGGGGKGAGSRLGLALSASATARPPAVLRSSAMDRLMLLERMEMEAAAAIQRRFRRHRRIAYWQRWLREKAAQEALARAWRAHSARQRARVWRARFFARVVLFQGRWRGALARMRVRDERAFLNDAATDIARVALGWLARLRVRRLRTGAAATRIAAFWRGCKGRAAADRLFLDTTATRIQRNVRRWQAQRAYRRRSSREATAASRIQQMYRKWRARAVRDARLWEREAADRRAWMELLAAEKAAADASAARLSDSTAVAIETSATTRLTGDWGAACEFIARKEFDLVSLQNERVKLSPRAIEEGWSAQLDADVRQNRAWVTEGKERALFEVALELRTAQAARADRLAQLADAVNERDELHARWIAERAALWRRDNEAAWSRAKDERRKNVADEKRRWAIAHFTHTGKPDVQRNQREAARQLRQLRAAAVAAAGGAAASRSADGSNDGGVALAASYFSGATAAGGWLSDSDGGDVEHGAPARSTARVTLGDADLLDLIRPLPTAADATAPGDDPHQRAAAAQLRQRMRLYLTDYRNRFGEELLGGGSAWFPDDEPAEPPPAAAAAGGLMTDGASPSVVPQLTDAAAGGTVSTLSLLLPAASPLVAPGQALFSPAAPSSSASGAPTPTPSSASAAAAAASLASPPSDGTAGALSSRSGFGGGGGDGGAIVTVHGKSTTVRALFADALRREPDDDLQQREAATDARLRQLGHRGTHRSLQEVAEQGRVARFDPTALAERHGAAALAVRSAVSGLSDDANDAGGCDDGSGDDALALARRVPDYVRLRHHAAAASSGGAAGSDGESTGGIQHAITLPGSGGAMAAAATVAALTARLQQRASSRGGSGGGYAMIGNSGVLTAAAERRAAHAREAAAYDVIGARVDHLTRQVAAVTGQAELQQYGALLRPLMDGVSRLMLNAVAADGTAAEVARVEASAGQLTAARKVRLAEIKAARRQQQPGESSTAESAAPSAAPTSAMSTSTTAHVARRNSSTSAAAPTLNPYDGAHGAAPPPAGRSSRGGSAVTVGATRAAAAAVTTDRPSTSATAAAGRRGDDARTRSSSTVARPSTRGAEARVGSAGAKPSGAGDGGSDGSPRAKTPTGLLVAAQAKLRQAAAIHGSAPAAQAAGRTSRHGGVGRGATVPGTTDGVAPSLPPRWTLVDELAVQKANLAQERRRLGAAASTSTAGLAQQRRGTPR